MTKEEFKIKHPSLNPSGWEIEDGWLNILDNFFDQCKRYYLCKGLTEQFTIVQIKEKFGYLRIHLDFIGEDYLIDQDHTDSDWVRGLIEIFEEASKEICESCGSHNDVKLFKPNGYWLKNYCKICRSKKAGVSK